MIDVCLLGTGGTQPLVHRWLTSLLVRYKGHAVLIDCGEGTQIAASKAGLGLKPIDKILITHLHADHISGLPGLLLTMGNMGRTETLSIVGPVGTERVVRSLCCIAPVLPFAIQVSELDMEEAEMHFLECDIRAFAVDHGGIPCYGYSFTLPRAGKFDAARAKEAGIPLVFWSRLQKGETVTEDGVTYTPDMVMGAPRRGIKLTYCTDSRPIPAIAEAAKDSDLFICEGMYGGDDMLPKALENKHMLFSEAAELAARAGAKELWFTHYSPSMPNPGEYVAAARAIFPNTYTPRDGWTKELQFAD